MSTAIMQGEKGEQMAEVHARNVAALTARVTAIKTAKVDAVADTRALKAFAIASGDNYPAQVVLKAPGDLTIQIGDVAHGQFANVLGIDKRYYDRMNAEAAPLLAHNLNWWLQQTPAERLLRLLKPEAYDVADRAIMAGMGAQLRLRGVLGKGYRTIDDADLVDAILPTLIERGAMLQEFSIDERRMHAKFFTEARDVQDIKRAYAAKYNVPVEQVGRHLNVGGQDISFVNEVLSAGVVIRHSEVGFASLGASFVTRVLKCLNDYVAESAINVRHVGGKNGSADEDVRFVSDATQLMDNAALLGRVQDTIAHQLSDGAITERAIKLIAAKTEAIELPVDKPLFEFVGNIGLNLGMTQAETELLKEETVKSAGEEGGRVKFAFVQGITAVARQMTDYDRRLEFERHGFALLNDDAAALLKLGRDAERQRAVKRN